MKNIKEIEITKELVDIYPGEKNGYKVIEHFNNGETVENYWYKEEVKLHNYLKEMEARLSSEEYSKLKDMFKMWGEFKFNKGIEDEAMTNAGADL